MTAVEFVRSRGTGSSSSSDTPSLRSLFLLLFGVAAAYGVAIFSGLYFLGLQQSHALQASATPLRQELVQLSSARIELGELVSQALALKVADKEAARELIDTLGTLELENAAIRAQRRLALQASLRSALSRMARPESALPIRMRELSAAVLLDDERLLLEARSALLDARTEMAAVTREFELLALQEVQRREALLEERIEGGIELLGIASLVGGLLLIGILSLLQRRVLSPLGELSGAIQSVEAGDLEQHLEPATTDELGQLALMFNRMSETLRMRATLEAEQRLAMTEDLQRSEDLFAEVLRRASELIVVLGPDQRILFRGPTWSRIAQLPCETAGERFTDLMPADQREDIDNAIRSAQIRSESTLRLALPLEDTSMGTFEFVFSRLDPSSGRTLAVGRDITQVLADEAERQHRSRLEAIGQITGGVAHDFNNLLLVIRGNLELLGDILKRDRARSEPDRELLEALEATDRAAGLTNSLLAYARKQTLKAEPVDLQALLEDLGRWIRRVLTPKINLIVEPPSSTLLIKVDKGQLETAVLNLAINARDAMPQGGKLTLSARRIDDPSLLRSEGDTVVQGVELSVVDTGAGMSESLVAQIFEPFFTTKGLGNGSGLGLSMVQGFVQQSGGTVTVDSTLGVGTAFNLRFPGFADMSAASELEGDTDPIGEARRTPSRRILLVEDESGVRRIVDDMLRSLGFSVHAVASAEEAVAYVTAGAPAPCELVLSDVLLAGGMDGVELSDHLAATHPSLPVLLTSGHPKETLANAPSTQRQLLMKPYERRELQKAIEQALAG